MLKERASFATVPRMPSPRPSGHALHARPRQARSARRARRVAGLVILAVVLLVTLLLTAFGSAGPDAVRASRPALAERLLPSGPPRPQVIALQGTLRIQLPISQDRVTAIGYHAAGDGALALEPLGTQANQGLLSRLVHRIFGGKEAGLRYYQLEGGQGPGTTALDVGAAPGTDVYSPVDGIVVGLTDFVISGQVYGVRVDIQPASASSVVVSLTHLRPDPALTVGSSVAAGSSKIGTVLDLSAVERQALARYTQDAGNHVSIEVHPAATLAIP